MKSIKIYLSILFTALLFASCEKEIEFKGEITDPLIVVNSYITPDSIISAHISESRFFLRDSVSFKNLENADVAVWVNGVYKEKMIHIEKGTYKGTHIPSIGEIIKLVVKVPNKKDVYCEAKIEPQPLIVSIDTANIWTGVSYSISTYGSSTNNGPTVWKSDTMAIIKGHQINYKLRFKDNPNERNYYRLLVITNEFYKVLDKNNNDTIIEIIDKNFNFTDVVSGNNSNSDPLDFGGGSYNEYNVFSDDLINGKEYPLSFSTNEDVYEYLPKFDYGQRAAIKKVVNIYLQSISKDYYMYLKSRSAAMAGTDFFSEQVQIHNNIVGGIGILGSYTFSNVVKVEL
jgi:hypothetical protein